MSLKTTLSKLIIINDELFKTYKKYLNSKKLDERAEAVKIWFVINHLQKIIMMLNSDNKSNDNNINLD